MAASGTDATTKTDPGAPATVVVSSRIRPDRVEEYRQWQAAMDRTVALSPGFLGTEVVPPGEGGTEWTVLYRFRSSLDLGHWLSSVERAELLDRGKHLFEGPPSQQVLIGGRRENVTVVVSHSIPSDQADAFLAWQQRLLEAEQTFPGFCGSETFPPVPGVQDKWTRVFSFDTDEHLNHWLESSQRRRLLDEGRAWDEFELHRVSEPFGSWFSNLLPSGGGGPAQWKTALSVLVGLYPTVVLLTLAISELWPHGKLWATLLLGNILSVALLTWVVMPVVTRALAWWLEPEASRTGRRLDLIGAAVSVAFLTFAALIFWLVTTQIWTLP